MDWIYFVLFATLMWSISNIADKYLIDKRIKKPLVMTILIRTSSLAPLIFIFPFVTLSLPSAGFLVWILLASIFAVGGLLIYYHAIQIGEISRTIPIFQFIPIFVLFLSFFFIGEVLEFFDYLGFVVLIIGGLVISAARLTRLFKIERVFLLVVFSSLLYAISYVIMKHVLTNVEYWSTFFLVWALQTLIISSLLLSKKTRKETKFYIKILGRKDKLIILMNAVVSVMAFIFNYFAISLGPVTLVEAAGNMQLAFTFLFAIIFTRFFPYIIKERFDRSVTVQKAAGIILIITGVLLTQLF